VNTPPENDNPPNGTHGAFSILHSGVQRQLWRLGWSHLRLLQVQAIHAILESEKPVVISAATASGKTEAAFLPVLSRIADEPTGSVRALYVGPLRALINDQFSRVEELCHYLEMPVHRWHGDVSDSHKRRLLKAPSGVLLLTPESLESLFVNRSPHLVPLFHGLRFVVIDELHAFLDNERGLHLRSLLFRLRGALGQSEPFRMVGLSATIGDETTARNWVSPQQADNVVFIHDHTQKELRLRVHGYQEIDDSDEGAGLSEYKIAQDIWKHCAGHTNLVFANSRGDVEVFADLCNQLSQERKSNDVFLVHHGSLARDIRQDTEERLKAKPSITAFCSSTLELGVDIGNVRMVGQIGAPWSVASLKQRAGRSGRREEEARLLRIYLACEEPDAKSDVFDRLHLLLIQTIAIIQLMLQGWTESTQAPACDLSTLTQQVISIIAQTGGANAQGIYEALCENGAFSQIEPALFARLLRRLGDKEVDVIEQTPTGDLILGLLGEKLRKNKDFYAVFATPIEYALLHGGRLLGTLPISAPPPVDEHLLFAGSRWQVIALDLEKREIHVQPARGKKRPLFSGAGGEISDRVRLMMREVLEGNEEYLYLDNEANRFLINARSTAQLCKICTSHFIELGANRSAWITWGGSRIQETLWAMLKQNGITAAVKGIALICPISMERLQEITLQMASQNFEALELASHIPNKMRRKYDWLLCDELLEVGLSRDYISIMSAISHLSVAEKDYKPKEPQSFLKRNQGTKI
jgi:ATP-dependent Lhr-like helicase